MPRGKALPSHSEETASQRLKRDRAGSKPANAPEDQARSFAPPAPEITFGVHAKNVLACAGHMRGVRAVALVPNTDFRMQRKSESAPPPAPVQPEPRRVVIVFRPAGAQTVQKVQMH
jgi:hypothetical protein